MESTLKRNILVAFLFFGFIADTLWAQSPFSTANNRLARECLWEIDAPTACLEAVRFFRFRKFNDDTWRESVNLGIFDDTLVWADGLEVKSAIFSVDAVDYANTNIAEFADEVSKYGVRGRAFEIETKNAQGQTITKGLRAVIHLKEPITMLRMLHSGKMRVLWTSWLTDGRPSLYDNQSIVAELAIDTELSEERAEAIPLEKRLKLLEAGNIPDPTIYTSMNSEAGHFLSGQLFSSTLHRRFSGVFRVGQNIPGDVILQRYFDEYAVDAESGEMTVNSAAGLWIYHALHEGWIEVDPNHPKVQPVVDYADNVRTGVYPLMYLKEMAWFDN